MKIEFCLATILIFLSSMQIVFGQEKKQIDQKKVLVCSDCGSPINTKPILLPKPEYPKAALTVRASGAVQVQITIDENGNVESAKAVSGHPLLWAESVKSALKSKWNPIKLSGKPIKVTGVIVYNFSLDEPNLSKQTEEPKQTGVKKSGRIVNLAGGSITGKEIKLPKPIAPFCNCRFGNVNSVSTVLVQAEIDEKGNISKATAISGHPILKIASERAARKSKFTPSQIDGERVKGKAIIVYKFLSVNKWSVKPLKVTIQKIEIENKSTN